MKPPLSSRHLTSLSVAAIFSGWLAAQVPASAARTYYVNCVHGHDHANGISPATAWRTLARASRQPYRPDDQLLLARGQTCRGQIHPLGSGVSGHPILLGAYGRGRRPLIQAGHKRWAIKLSDQSYWRIKHLRTQGGDPYGIWITGHKPRMIMKAIHLYRVSISHVHGQPTQKASGLLVMQPQGRGERLEQVRVNRVTARHTTQWAGIYLAGARFSGPQGPRGRDLVVRNSVVRGVGGDGIVIFVASHAKIEHSRATHTGQTTVTAVGTPSAIWTWDCHQCTVEYNEAGYNHSPGSRHDGGDFDSDYYNRNTLIQYNYGHDSDGYCVSVFGAAGRDTNVNTVIRYNLCVNNGRNPHLSRQGNFFFSTWQGGSIRNARVYDNLTYWNPADPRAYAVRVQARFDPRDPNLFYDNRIISTAPGMVWLARQLRGFFQLRNDIYRWPKGKAPHWRIAGKVLTGLRAWGRQLRARNDLRGQGGKGNPANLPARWASPVIYGPLPPKAKP